MAGRDYVCQDCGKVNTLPPDVVAKYPNWVPKKCLSCRDGRRPTPDKRATRQESLDQFHDGPQTGVFTDGFCEPNPGSGGWGAVKVIDGQIIEERCGHEPQTTNNRMELKALIEGYKMLGQNEDLAVYSDSELCVNTTTKWAPTWERNGWTRGKKREDIKNLDLVKELYELAKSHPKTKLQWIKGHAGLRWNEYADALSRADEGQVA